MKKISSSIFKKWVKPRNHATSRNFVKFKYMNIVYKYSLKLQIVNKLLKKLEYKREN